MNHIDGFFSKFKGIFAGSAHKKEIVAAACLSRAKVEILPGQIEIQGGVVKLGSNLSPAAKSVIFVNKAKILEEINSKLKPPLSDIR